MKPSDFPDQISRAIADAAAEEAGALDPAEIGAALTSPPRAEMGDLAFPCFLLSRKLRKAPPAIASELAGKIEGRLDIVEGVEAIGPYLNFRFHRGLFAEAVLRGAIRAGKDYGKPSEGSGGVIAIDYSSPNIAKPFHVGHLRSTIIGAALYRIFGALGYRPVGINHLGDWGTQFGKQIVGLKRWGRPEDSKSLMALNRLYAQYHAAEEQDPALVEEARDWFRRQEAGDPEALRLWRDIRETSLEYFKAMYERLGVRFDAYVGESFFNDKMDAVVERARSIGLARESQGALVIDLSSLKIDTPALLKKADGTTLYLTRDLAAALHRYETYRFEKLLYVVGTAQSLHFQQLFGALKLMGYEWADRCVHVNFGLVHGMSSRRGDVIYLEELLDEAKARALRYMRESIEKRSDLEDEEAVAEAVGIAAIFFSDLSKQRIKDYDFDWDRAISFEGDTGPYLLNAHARIAGIIRKCGVELDPDADLSPLVEPEAHQLVLAVSRYGDVLREAARLYEPSVVTSYLLEVARALHSSYRSLRVKDEEPRLARARLLLFAVVKSVLSSGLGILGIPALERM